MTSFSATLMVWTDAADEAEVRVHGDRASRPPIATVTIAGLKLQSYGGPDVLADALDAWAARVRAEHAAYLAAHPEGDAS